MQLALLASHPQFSSLNAAFWTQLDAISRCFFQLDAGSDVFSQRGQMKLRARQKYDYRDLDRGESKLIRIGHALWRDRRKLVDTVAEREGIHAALETVWQAKREYRAELERKRASRFSEFHRALANGAEREIAEVKGAKCQQSETSRLQ